jgi:hypothetical protein
MENNGRRALGAPNGRGGIYTEIGRAIPCIPIAVQSDSISAAPPGSVSGKGIPFLRAAQWQREVKYGVGPKSEGLDSRRARECGFFSNRSKAGCGSEGVAGGSGDDWGRGERWKRCISGGYKQTCEDKRVESGE